ncbi:MAG: flotillin-like FloA family protein [Planctomycetota bacterium]
MSGGASTIVMGQAGGGVASVAVVVGVVVCLVALIALAFIGRFFGLWLQALLAGHPVGLFELIEMWLRRIDPRMVVLTYLQARKAGIEVSPAALKAHALAGGDVPGLVNTLVAAKREGLILGFDDAAAAELAGVDPLDQARLPTAAAD